MRPGRRMGVALATGADVEQARALARAAAESIAVQAGQSRQ